MRPAIVSRQVPGERGTGSLMRAAVPLETVVFVVTRTVTPVRGSVHIRQSGSACHRNSDSNENKERDRCLRRER